MLSRHGMVFHSTTYLHTSLPALPDTHTQHAHAGRQQSPADPVSRGTLPTAPAPTPRSCKRLRFFHGRTAARRQMGKWATVRVGIGMRCHPCVRHHRLLARALAAVASRVSEDQTGSTLSWCRSRAPVQGGPRAEHIADDFRDAEGELEQGGSPSANLQGSWRRRLQALDFPRAL